jgi:hypothetical protein
MNYQLCRAYLNVSGGVLDIVEAILSRRFGGLSQKEKETLKELRGKRNPVVDFPNHEFKATISEILETFVEQRFDKMVAEFFASKPNYPLTFRDIIERYGE